MLTIKYVNKFANYYLKKGWKTRITQIILIYHNIFIYLNECSTAVKMIQ
jgi:hypothetical protein